MAALQLLVWITLLYNTKAFVSVLVPKLPTILPPAERVHDLHESHILASARYNPGEILERISLTDTTSRKRTVVVGDLQCARLLSNSIVSCLTDTDTSSILVNGNIVSASFSRYADVYASDNTVVALHNDGTIDWCNVKKSSSRSVNFKWLLREYNHNDCGTPCCLLYHRGVTIAGRQDGGIDIIGNCRKRMVHQIKAISSGVTSMCVCDNRDAFITIFTSHVDGSVFCVKIFPGDHQRSKWRSDITEWVRGSSSSSAFTTHLSSNGRFLVRTSTNKEVVLGSVMSPKSDRVIPVKHCSSAAMVSKTHLVVPSTGGVYWWTLNN